MTTLYTAGPYDTINFVAQAARRTPSAITIPGLTAEPNFPLTNLYDGDPASLTKYNGTTGTTNLVIDLIYNKNPSFTNWAASLPDFWEVIGSVEEENTIFNSTPASAQLNTGGIVRQVNKVMAGNPYIVGVFLRGDGTNNTNFYIRNLQTGMWLNSSNAWVSSKTATFTRSTATFSGVTRNFTVEPTSTSISSVVDLEFRAEQPTGGPGYVDDVTIWPHWNFAAVFEHEISTESSAFLQSDDSVDFTSPTSQFIFTAPRRKPAFYGSFTATSERFARLQITHPSLGTAGKVENSIGEFFIGYTRTLTRGLEVPLKISPSVDLMGGGYGIPFAIQKHESSTYQTKIPHVTKDEYDLLKLDLGRAGKWGSRTTILVPNTTLPEVHIGNWDINDARAEYTFSLDGEFTEKRYTPRIK